MKETKEQIRKDIHELEKELVRVKKILDDIILGKISDKKQTKLLHRELIKQKERLKNTKSKKSKEFINGQIKLLNKILKGLGIN